jgi:6-phosphogluconolactonase
MNAGSGELRVFESAAQMARHAASEFSRRAIEAVASRGWFRVALAGGSTPRQLYALLASTQEPFRDQVPWAKAHFFWGDERTVPPSSPESNYRMANEAMLSKVPVPAENVHRILAELPDPQTAADRYEEELRRAFELDPAGKPRFDLVILGMGVEGHTASLFPGSEWIYENTRLVVAVWVEKLNAFRITLTPAVFNQAACVMFLISGEEKAEALKQALEGPRRPELFPVQAIQPVDGSLLWLVDRAAASKLSR